MKRVWVPIAAAAFSTLLAACSSGGSASTKSTPTASTVAKPGTAQITSFTVPTSVQCQGHTSTTVNIQWATTGANKRELYIDGRPIVEATSASGAVETPVHCDALPHDVVIIAYDDAGRKTTAQKMFDTNQ
ncbi:MAG TPA: hypothetical protein VEP49_18630 [Acidimicrobiia bacterium]|nr:hypothetical protein [Acidimicrobiia bacterium]